MFYKPETFVNRVTNKAATKTQPLDTEQNDNINIPHCELLDSLPAFPMQKRLVRPSRCFRCTLGMITIMILET